jgi:hypothetical protein
MSLDEPPVKVLSVGEFTGSCMKATAPGTEPLVFCPGLRTTSL